MGGHASDTFADYLGEGPPSQYRVWPEGVIVAPPVSEHEPDVGHRGEHCLVEAFVAQTAIEALDEAVLHRLVGRDAVPFDPSLVRAGEWRYAPSWLAIEESVEFK